MAQVPGAAGMAARLNVGSAANRVSSTPETMMLWALVALELVAMVGLRRYFRRHHGG